MYAEIEYYKVFSVYGKIKIQLLLLLNNALSFGTFYGLFFSLTVNDCTYRKYYDTFRTLL